VEGQTEAAPPVQADHHLNDVPKAVPAISDIGKGVSLDNQNKY
jgi:hypothetical protein